MRLTSLGPAALLNFVSFQTIRDMISLSWNDRGSHVDPIQPRATSTYCGATIVVPLLYEASFPSTSRRDEIDAGHGKLATFHQSGESNHEALFP